MQGKKISFTIHNFKFKYVRQKKKKGKKRFTNPFSDTHTDLFNLVTKVVMPETVKEDLCEE